MSDSRVPIIARYEKVASDNRANTSPLNTEGMSVKLRKGPRLGSWLVSYAGMFLKEECIVHLGCRLVFVQRFTPITLATDPHREQLAGLRYRPKREAESG